MAVLIFKLRYVPLDEVVEVRDLLSENDINFYETSAGVLGISMPGLWVKDEDQADKAKQLIDEYQTLRQKKAKEEHRLIQRTYVDMFKEAPIRFLSIILAIALIGFFTVFSFFKF